MTLEPEDTRPDRREFFLGMGRWSIMGGLFALGGWLVGRDRPTTGTCERAPVCGGCALLADCSLPRAESERRLTPDFSGPRGRREG